MMFMVATVLWYRVWHWKTPLSIAIAPRILHHKTMSYLLQGLHHPISPAPAYTLWYLLLYLVQVPAIAGLWCTPHAFPIYHVLQQVYIIPMTHSPLALQLFPWSNDRQTVLQHWRTPLGTTVLLPAMNRSSNGIGDPLSLALPYL